jgi:hypothetical protein
MEARRRRLTPCEMDRGGVWRHTTTLFCKQKNMVEIKLGATKELVVLF